MAAEFRFKSVGHGKTFKPYAGMRISGVTIDGSREMKLLFPSVISYKGGLYYEYLSGSMVYAKVSQPGDGPNTIYGMKQRLGMRPLIADFSPDVADICPCSYFGRLQCENEC